MTVTPNRKIKLVIGISDFRIGGAQKLAADITCLIDQNSFETHLIVLFQSQEQETFYNILPPHIFVHTLNFQSFRDLQSWKRLYKLLRNIKPDIVWSHLYFSNTVFRVLKLLLGYKVVTVEHNTYVNKTFAQKTIDWILANATYRIVAVSDYVADFTAKQEFIARSKFQVIYNGVDLAALQKKANSADKKLLLEEFDLNTEHKIILNVGQLIRQKNQELLIEAFSDFEVLNPNYKLLILGEGSMRASLEATINKLDLTGKVFLPGIRKNVAEYMAISDFFVLSSRFEGFPIVAVEALACSLPIISTPVSGSSVYVVEESSGILTEHTKASIAEAMQKMAALSDSEKEQFKIKSSELATHFDIATVTQSYEALFKRAVK